MQAKHEVSSSFLYFIMVCMLIAGTSNTLVLKFQDRTIADGLPYNHPYLQCAFMFIGEFICFGIYHLKVHYIKRNGGLPLGFNDENLGVITTEGKHKTNINPLWLAIPALLDMIASTLIFISLTMIDASVY